MYKQEYEIIDYSRFLKGKYLSFRDVKSLGKFLSDNGLSDIKIELRLKKFTYEELLEEIHELAPEMLRSKILSKMPTLISTISLVRMFITINIEEETNIFNALKQKYMDAVITNNSLQT